MGCRCNNNMAICGDFNIKVTKDKPAGWIDNGYKIKVPYPFKWRSKLGRATCDCSEVLEHFAPWYGVSWYHLDGCAIMKHVEKYPGINNLMDGDFSIIAITE